MHGYRALHIAVRERMDPDIIKMLGRGANLEARNHLQLRTPFLYITEPRMAAPAKTHAEMLQTAKLLAGLGADVRTTDKQGCNLLFGAARERAVELFQWLLDHGLSIDSEDISGRTVLHVAAENGRTETLTWLLDKGANRLHRTTLGKTPLHLAVTARKLEAVKLLTTLHGEELIIKDNNGKTPLDLARVGKHAPPKEGTLELREKAKKEMEIIYDYLFKLEHPFS
jgi:ankyrin repeat protein